jgi:hypothetical protein
MTQHSKLGELDPVVKNFLWGMVSKEEKKKCIEKHKKKYEDYVREYNKFVMVNYSVPFLCQFLSNRILYLVTEFSRT